MTRHPTTGADGVAHRNLMKQFRVDPDLLALLEQDAEAYGRTVSQSIRWHLRRSLELEQQAA